MAKKRARRQPQRTCIGCRRGFAKRELTRIVRMPSGEVIIDPRGKISGRGAYLCADRRCWITALEDKRIEHALKITPSAEEYAALWAYASQLAEGEAEGTSTER